MVLFLLTVATTTLVGADRYASFYLGFRTAVELPFSFWELIVRGLWYSVSILAILGAHEFGHYYACRYYGVDASLPYFLPVPPIVLSGTLGAFIRIRQQIPTKRALFDIGIAGPLAGFVVLVPVLMIGMYMSQVVQMPKDFDGTLFELGEPLLFKAATWLTFGSVPDGYTVSMHPVAFAAWFGMLATTLNLFPVGQTDGGHICYSVLGRHSTTVSYLTIACLAGLSFFSTSWVAVDGADDRDARRLRAATPVDIRRARASGSHAHLGRGVRRRRLRDLLCAGPFADRRSLRRDALRRALTTHSTDRRRSSSAAVRQASQSTSL